MRPFSFLIPILLFWLSGFSPVTYALGEQAGNLSTDAVVDAAKVDQVIANQPVDRRIGQYGTANPSASIEVFGQQLFLGGFSGVRSESLNDHYRVAPGDQVILRVWGVMEVDRVIPVDVQGNIFIPTIGPVAVGGLTQDALDGAIKQAIGSIYKNNVQVYSQLKGIQPISVFVTGFVDRPGRYAGNPTDSVIYFLNQAGGIDSNLGSYRKVLVKRQGKLIKQMDLYDFLLKGKMDHLQFVEGDTIVVVKSGPQVEVLMNSADSLTYELADGPISGQHLAPYLNLDARVSHVLVRGVRDNQVFSDYLTLEAFNRFALSKNDSIEFISNQLQTQILVKLEGSYLGVSHFVLPKGTTLKALLANIPVEANLTATESISLRRLAIAEKQRVSLDESLRRLESTYLTASSDTAEEAAIRVKEAEMIRGFVEKAKKVEPNGRLVVTLDGFLQDVTLQDGDVITLPEVTRSVMISGQVLVPQSIIYHPNLMLEDYINKTGGYSEQADQELVIIIRQSGEVIADKTADIRPGDEILVLPEVPTKHIELAKSVTQILYQIAVAASVALSL